MTRFAFKPAAQAAVLLALAGTLGSASATLVTLPSQTGSIGNSATVTDIITVPGTVSASFTAVIKGINNQGDVLTFGLYDALNHLVATSQTPSDVVSTTFKRETFTNYYGNLAAGAYTLKLVSGVTGGGTYAISGSYNVATTPVPEPVSATLALAGAAVALTLRRRSKI